jgi:hypothetical protein
VLKINGALAFILTIVLAACGGSSSPAPTPTPTPQPQPNRAPTITSMVVAPAFGIAGVTQFNVSSSAADADGDTLTYTWDFADGTRTGATVAYNYGNVTGASDVKLTVTAGNGGTVSDKRQVTVGNLSGDWSGTVLNAIKIKAHLEQAIDGSVTGTWSGSGNNVLSVTGILDPAATNRINGDATFKLRFKITRSGNPGGFDDFTYEGRMDTTGNTLTGGLRGSGFGGEPMKLDRTQ